MLKKINKKRKAQAKQVGKFLMTFFIVFVLLFLSIDFYLINVEWIYANILNSLMELFGQKGQVLVKASENVVWIIFPKITIQISLLCAGLVELFVLFAAIISSFGISKEKKAIGLLWSLGIVFLFNNLRILLTTLFLFSTNLEFADLAHNIIFRISLFAVIVGVYYYWLLYKRNK